MNELIINNEIKILRSINNVNTARDITEEHDIKDIKQAKKVFKKLADKKLVKLTYKDNNLVPVLTAKGKKLQIVLIPFVDAIETLNERLRK